MKRGSFSSKHGSEMMQQPQARSFSLVLWLLSTIVMLLIYPFTYALAGSLLGGNPMLGAIGSAGFVGTLGGGTQALLLRRTLNVPAYRWLFATMLGWIVGWTTVSLFVVPSAASVFYHNAHDPNEILLGTVSMYSDEVMFGVVAWLVVGVAVGSCQWLVLRGTFANASVWLAASAVAWVGGALTYWAVEQLHGVGWILQAVLDTVLAGMVIGLITGMTLKWVAIRGSG